MYQSDIFCLFSNQSLIIDTEISKIISLSMVIHFFIFPQIIVLGSKKRVGVNWRGGAINGKNTVCEIGSTRISTPPFKKGSDIPSKPVLSSVF